MDVFYTFLQEDFFETTKKADSKKSAFSLYNETVRL